MAVHGLLRREWQGIVNEYGLLESEEMNDGMK